MKKIRSEQWKEVNTTEEHYKSMLWCLSADIKVHPKKTKGGFKLVCVKGGVGFESGIVHKENVYQQKIWDYYIYLYKKFKK